MPTSKPWKLLNADAIRTAVLVTEPYPYLIVDQLIRSEALAGVVETFPEIPKRGSFPLNAVPCSGPFAALMEEMQSDELRALIGERLGMDLDGKPAMLTLRGYTNERDGHIHTDSTDKLVTVLLYLNPAWQAGEGKLRVLYDKKNLDRYAAEISPEAGHSLIFRVTPNCWHGHHPFTGVRRSVQLNYVASQEARQRHMKMHRFSAFLKGLLSRKNETSPAH